MITKVFNIYNIIDFHKVLRNTSATSDIDTWISLNIQANNLLNYSMKTTLAADCAN